MIKPNSILIEPSTFLSPLISLENKEKLSPRDFFNLSTFIESLVLHDKVFTFGVNRKYYGLPLVEQLRENNIMNFFVEDMYVYRKPLQDFYSPEVDYNIDEYERKRIFYQEYSLGISNNHSLPYVPSLENTKLVLKLNEIGQSDRLQSNILEYYEQIEKSFIEDLKTIREKGKPIKIFIPPIMAIVLSRSSSLNEFYSVIFELRNEYKPLRDKFRDYEIAIKDDDASLSESLKAAKNLEDELNILTASLETRDNRMVLELCDFFKELPVDLFDPKKGVGSDKLIKFLLGKPLEWIKNVYKKRKISYFLSLQNKANNISHYNELVHKTFGFNYSKKEIETFYSQYKEIVY